jgi:putative two-component system response regulator
LQNDIARILIADDNEMNRDLLSRRVTQLGHEVTCAADGREAIVLLDSQEFDLALLDIMMPEVNGFQVLDHIKNTERLAAIPVIMITSLDDTDSAIRCIEMGAEDYLTKPFSLVLLRARIGAGLMKKRAYDREKVYREQLEHYKLHLENRVHSQDDQIFSGQLATIFAMSKLADSKDPETGAHLERLREYCKVIAEHLATLAPYQSEVTPEFVAAIYAASPLHDIGKVGIPDRILLKEDRLDPDEWHIMKTHTIIGAETLRAVDQQHPGNRFIEFGIQIAESHHEKWDGSGYPYHLKGTAIPLPARILSLADVYDALTSERCYKKAFPHTRSRDMIVERRGKDFDPDIVDAFLAIEKEFLRIRDHFRDPEAAQIAKIS